MSEENRPGLSAPHESPGDDDVDDAVIGRAFRWSLAAIGALAIPVAVGVSIYNRPVRPITTLPTPLVLPERRQRPAVEVPRVVFRDITQAAGIDFVQENGARGEKLLPETMGSGCAFVDFNNDGFQDVLLVNSCPWPWNASEAGRTGATPALYRNDGRGQFENVTAAAGLNVSFYGMGVAVGDYDNDGWSDLYFTAVGRNHLFHNVGGRFEEVTGPAGVAGRDDQWSSCCGWFDYNRDGRLDLFVCNYVHWSKEIDQGQDFKLVGVGRAYGPPTAFEGAFCTLYRNDGDGKFSDVSEAAGLFIRNPATGVPMGKSLGLTFVDLDRDDWLDVVVANDTVQNFVFHNERNGTFLEIGALVGVAFDPSGNARGAMGIDAARFRNDDALGLAIGNFANEMTALYVSQGGSMQFSDEAIATGLGPPSRLELKFGLFFFDYDLDSRLDLLAANGHLEDEISKVQASQTHAQPPHLFWNCGPDQGAEFLPATPDTAGPDFFRPMVGRGAAYADIDGDGDLDVLLTANHGPPRLLRNDQQTGHHWLRFRLRGRRSPRDAIGAWVEVLLGKQLLSRQVMPTRSYLSQVELPVTIGIGSAETVGLVRILWPDGSIQKVEAVLDRVLEIEQEAQ